MNPSNLRFFWGIMSAALAVGFLAAVFTSYFLNASFVISPKSLMSLKALPKLNRSQLFLAIGLFLCFLIMTLDDFFLGFVLTIFVICGWYVQERGPSLKKKIETKRKEEKMRELFPQSLEMSVQALKTGQTIPQVLDYLSRECPAPLKEELLQVSAEINLGVSAEQSLSKMGERFPDFTEFHQFLESYKISRQTGANLTHLLEVLLEGLEEKNRILRKMDAMTAQARLSGIMMGLLPFLLAFVFFLMDPELITPLFTEKIGWAILLLAAVLETIGFLWIRQLLQLEV